MSVISLPPIETYVFPGGYSVCPEERAMMVLSSFRRWQREFPATH